MDIKPFEAWVGRQTQDRELLATALVRRLAAALDRDPAAFADGGLLPMGWHAVLFAPVIPTQALDPDGHPPKGDLLPPLPLPRRLFAGRRLSILQPLRIGTEVTRTSEVTQMRQVEGKSGALVFVTLRHTLAGPDGGDAVVEEQDIAYRKAATPGAPALSPAGASPPLEDAEWSVPLQFDPSTLFRFSAAVFNAHRIHYDADYARDVEGYDGLIVNASLVTLHMLRQIEMRGAHPVASVAVRNKGLIKAGQPVELRGSATGTGQSVQAIQGGLVCVEMSTT